MFEEAVEIMSTADHIYALGFGFHPLNLERLQINKLKKKIVCSSFGLTKHECMLIEDAYPALELDKFGNENLDFLRNNLYL